MAEWLVLPPTSVRMPATFSRFSPTGHQHAAGGELGQVHPRHPQQDGQQAVPDVPHVGGALAHEFILHPGEHIRVHGADGVHRGLGAGAAVNGLLHLGVHEGVGQHGDLADEDLGLLLPHLGPDALGHGVGAVLKFLQSGLEALLFRLLAGITDLGVVQLFLPHAHGAAQAHAAGGGNAL